MAGAFKIEKPKPASTSRWENSIPYEKDERTKKDDGSFVNSSLSYRVDPPKLPETALYGLAGQIIKKIEPHTETHPAALLLQLLTGFGNMVGRGAFFMTECDRQHANLFCVIVGESSRGRKGTSWGHVRSLLDQADPDWVENRILSGVASGEGVIYELKDPEEEEGAEEGEGETEKDKRLLLMEGEFGSVLRVMQREGSTVSSMIRNAWDTGMLRNLANKNRDKNGFALRASNCHISVIGHITRAELSKLMDENDSSNGFANRFLWVHSARVRLLPDGGNIRCVNFEEEIRGLQQAVRLAQGRGEMIRTPGARDYWHSIYRNLTMDHPGRWGQVTSRGEAQVVRLALIFSLLDGGDHITLPHIQAAETVWNYCCASARWAFMESLYSRKAQNLLDALGQGPMTLSQISREVFRGNSRRDEIEECVREIAHLIDIGTQTTAGRDATVYSLRTPASE